MVRIHGRDWGGGGGGRSVAPAAKAVHAFTPLRTFALSDSFEMTLKTLSLVLEGGGGASTTNAALDLVPFAGRQRCVPALVVGKNRRINKQLRRRRRVRDGDVRLPAATADSCVDQTQAPPPRVRHTS